MTTEDDMKKLPIRPFPCKSCAHLRDDGVSVMVECRWWIEFDGYPMVTPWFSSGPYHSTARMTRKQVYGPHTDEAPLSCAAFAKGEKL
jgi:hypothetical protein